MQSFTRRLIAEFKRGGKKTVVLGLLLLIGCYFWVPMAWKDAPVDLTQNGGPISDDPFTTNHQSSPAISNLVQDTDWRHRKHWLDEQLILKPKIWNELVRDPFGWEWLKSLSQGAQPPNLDLPVMPLSRLEVSSTLVTPHYRAAIINSIIYHPGERIEGMRYVVKDILSDAVVLERDGVEVRVPVNASE